MTVSWLGALITFQVTFTELFIAVSVMLTGPYRFGLPDDRSRVQRELP